MKELLKSDDITLMFIGVMVERFEKLSGTAGNLTKGSADTRAESLSDEVVEKLISNLQEVVHDFRQNLDGLTRLAKG